jgi:hypothetical protein
MQDYWAERKGEAVARVEILTFSDGRDSEKLCRNVVVCELLAYEGFGGGA